MKKLAIPVGSVLVLLLTLAGWKLYVWAAGVPPFLLPAPEQVARRVVELIADGTLVRHSAATLASILIGFLIGSFLGFLGGYLLARSRALETVLFPYVMIVQSTPKVSLIPLFVIWFGLGIGSKLLLIILSAFFPVMVNTITGFRSVPQEYFDLMHILNARQEQTLFKVQLPLATPLLMAGLKVAMVQAVIGAIVSEWVAGGQGLGYLLVYGSTQYDSQLLIAAILATTLLGVLLYEVLDLCESRLLHWHESKTVFTEGS